MTRAPRTPAVRRFRPAVETLSERIVPDAGPGTPPPPEVDYYVAPPAGLTAEELLASLPADLSTVPTAPTAPSAPVSVATPGAGVEDNGQKLAALRQLATALQAAVTGEEARVAHLQGQLAGANLAFQNLVLVLNKAKVDLKAAYVKKDAADEVLKNHHNGTAPLTPAELQAAQIAAHDAARKVDREFGRVYGLSLAYFSAEDTIKEADGQLKEAQARLATLRALLAAVQAEIARLEGLGLQAAETVDAQVRNAIFVGV